MIVLHIGLRKTGSTFLQKKVFPIFKEEKFENVFLPYNSDSSKLIRALKDRDYLFIKKKFIGLVNENFLNNEIPVIVSAEGLSFPSAKKGAPLSAISRARSSNFYPTYVHDYPIIETIKFMAEMSKSLGLGELKVILGIRSQADFLASEYSQQSIFEIRPSQGKFESTVEKYLRSGDEYLCYSKWAREISIVVGGDNLLMYHIDDLRSVFGIKKIINFINPEIAYNFNEFENLPSPVNKNRISEDSWLIRPLQLQSLMDRYFDFHERNFIFYIFLKLLSFLSFFMSLFGRVQSIHLSTDLRDKINERYKADNEVLSENFKICV